MMNRCTDFNNIYYGDILILEEVHRLLFTAITNKHAGELWAKVSIK